WNALCAEHYSSNLQALAQLGNTHASVLVGRAKLAEEPPVSTAAELVRNLALESQHRDEVERHTSFLGRLSSAVAWGLGARDNNDFEQLLDREWKFQHDREFAAALLNDQLLRTDFYERFQPLADWLRASPDGKRRAVPAEFRGE